MLRLSCVMLLACTFFTASRSQAYEWTWGAEHPEAKVALLKIFEKHSGFREALVEYTDNHHETFKSYVDFLAIRHEGTLNEFVKERIHEEKETPVLRSIHEKYPEGFADFRAWVHEHKEAAIALTHHEGEIHHLEAVAERHK